MDDFGYIRRNGSYWCADCKCLLRVVDGDPIVHQTWSDCETASRKAELVRRFWSAVGERW